MSKSARKSAKIAAKQPSVAPNSGDGASISPYRLISQMEPLWPARAELEEKAIELLKRSQRLAGGLHPITQRQVARLLRLMNSYYSNLIEGNVTHPLDLERAQHSDYSSEPRKKALQIEGKAHIEVEDLFEAELRNSPDLDVTSPEYLLRMHKAFYDRMPEEFKWVVTVGGETLPVVSGAFRSKDVEVGHHVPPDPSAIPRFMERFHEVYTPGPLGSVRRILAAAAAHHRLAWIHPFQDGNGRVTRLFTQLYFMRADLDSNGLWSLSRGLARKQQEYYAALEAADEHRYNDYDGRGNLSQRGLDDFVSFLLDVSLDQVDFMSGLLDIDGMLERLTQYAELLSIRGELDSSAKYILTEIFLRGELARGDVPRIAGTSERNARRITQRLSKLELVHSETPLGPLCLNFPIKIVPIVFPALSPAAGI